MNLNSLTLQDNQLTGIPPEIGNLTSIKEMNLLDNQFTGEIPPELGNLTNLEELSMSCTSENLDFLKKCVNIKKLTINLGLGSEKSQSQGNIDALKYLTKLEELTISGLPDSDENFSYAGLLHKERLQEPM